MPEKTQAYPVIDLKWNFKKIYCVCSVNYGDACTLVNNHKNRKEFLPLFITIITNYPYLRISPTVHATIAIFVVSCTMAGCPVSVLWYKYSWLLVVAVCGGLQGGSATHATCTLITICQDPRCRARATRRASRRSTSLSERGNYWKMGGPRLCDRRTLFPGQTARNAGERPRLPDRTPRGDTKIIDDRFPNGTTVLNTKPSRITQCLIQFQLKTPSKKPHTAAVD